MIRRRFTPATLLPTFPSKIPAVSQSVRCKWYSMCNTCHSRLYPALPPTSVSQRMRELRAILDTTHGPCACRLVGPGTCWPERAGPRKQRTRPCPLGSNRAGGRAPARGLPPAPSLASGPGTRSTTAPRRRAEPGIRTRLARVADPAGTRPRAPSTDRLESCERARGARPRVPRPYAQQHVHAVRAMQPWTPACHTEQAMSFFSVSRKT
jgi:hypothetical protein